VTLSGFIEAFTTTTTIADVHRGVVLPEARIIVIVVPVTVFCIYWFWLRRRGRP
jgi:hypothetical protein